MLNTYIFHCNGLDSNTNRYSTVKNVTEVRAAATGIYKINNVEKKRIISLIKIISRLRGNAAACYNVNVGFLSSVVK